ncbi:MAG TPA: NADH-quinone oxidoreductase subunit N [Anaerolineae bacterium]|nr:NADH-quinone oxidoreductase subunit N [Anaerolineae bacterium]
MDLSQLNTGLLAVLPEILLLALGFVVIGADLFVGAHRKRALGGFTTLGMLVVLIVIGVQSAPLVAGAQAQPTLGNMVVGDLTTQLFRGMFVIAGALTCLISMDFKSLKQAGEYYGLVTFAVLGMCLMAAASDIIMLYVALETTSISLYLLAGYLRGVPLSSEAGMKYFLFGAFTSTILLYGLSLLYGFTGQTGYGALVDALSSLGPESVLPTVVVVILILVGFGFKVAAVPFHMWTPDVYEGAPTPITAFISVASKAAGFAVLLRVFLTVFTPLQDQWVTLISILAVLTMTLGNLLAIPQRNIKRLLAYSSIAQAGYVLIGVASARSGANAVFGPASALFYLGVYVLTNIAAFVVVEVVTNETGTENLYEMAGLSKRSFWLALGLMMAMLSLGGVPPLAGFFAKFYVFQAAVGSGLVWLAIVGVLNAIVGLYYYLIVIRVIFVDPGQGELTAFRIPLTLRTGLFVTTAGILILGVLVTPWYNLVTQAATTLVSGS